MLFTYFKFIDLNEIMSHFKWLFIEKPDSNFLDYKSWDYK